MYNDDIQQHLYDNKINSNAIYKKLNSITEDLSDQRHSEYLLMKEEFEE